MTSNTIPNALLRKRKSIAILVIAVVCLSLVTFAISARNKDDHRKLSSEEGEHNFPPTAWDYAQLVEPILGVPPKVDLGEAIEMPMYVKGKQVHGVFQECDNPSRLAGKICVSGSVVQSYEGQMADGTPLPDVVWVAFGRNAAQLNIGLIGSVQMIGYDRATGATAFFESSDAIEPWAYLDEEAQRLKGVMPWIDDPDEFNRAYRTPGVVQCVSCHQNDPFIHNSFIDAAKNPETGRPVVPVVRTRDMEYETDLPYYVIGGETWDMRTIYIERNGCVGCHRIGMSTLNMFVRAGWNPHEEMPPGRPGTLQEDLEELLDCWENTPEKTPDCHWIVPPSDTTVGQVVRDDYPFKAAFNRPGVNKAKQQDDFDVEAEIRELEIALEKAQHAADSGSISSDEASERIESIKHWITLFRQYQSGLADIEDALTKGEISDQQASMQRGLLKDRIFSKEKGNES